MKFEVGSRKRRLKMEEIRQGAGSGREPEAEAIRQGAEDRRETQMRQGEPAGEQEMQKGRTGTSLPGQAGKPVVDVIIPTYRPGKEFRRLLQRIKQQTFPVNRILVINTEETYWDPGLCEGIDNLEVHHVSRQEFDHGNTRNLGAEMSRAEVMIFMTDDAVPKGRCLVERLVKALSWQGPQGEQMAVAYARQLPARDCQPVERCTREFNYPKRSCVKTRADLPRLGIKTYFASNVCCAYQKDIFEKQGGFVRRTLFNEDMIYAAGVIQAGYGVAYVADARVIHSHNLTAMQQFHRNFDMGVSQAEHPEIFSGLVSEGEGIRLVKKTAKELIRQGNGRWLLSLVQASAGKYAGYRLGKTYHRLPEGLVRWCSMCPQYWQSLEDTSRREDSQEYFDWEEMAGRGQKK